MITKDSELHHSIGSLIDVAHPGPKTDRDYLDISELTSNQEMVVVLTHYMNTYVHKHQSWSSGILIMLGVLAVVGYICKV